MKCVLLVQVYSWAWLGLLGAQTDFKVPFGHVETRRLVSPPCVGRVTSNNTSKRAGQEINLSGGEGLLSRG